MVKYGRWISLKLRRRNNHRLYIAQIKRRHLINRCCLFLFQHYIILFFRAKCTNLSARLHALPKEGDNSPSFGRAWRRAYKSVFQYLKTPEVVDDKGLRDVSVGYTASKKVGNAVCRNRAKRRLRGVVNNIVRLNKSFKNKGLSFVLIARYATMRYPFKQMEKDLLRALKKAKKSA